MPEDGPDSTSTIPETDATGGLGGDTLDLRDQHVIPEVWDAVDFLVAGGLILLALTVLIFFMGWLSKRAKRPEFPSIPTHRDATLKALENLRAVAPGQACYEVADQCSKILRQHLHRTHGVLANFRTTEELSGKSISGDRPPPPPGLEVFANCLNDCDALRFSHKTESGKLALPTIDQAIAAVSRKQAPPPLPNSGAPQNPIALSK